MNELLIYKLNEFQTQENDTFIIGGFQIFHLGHYQLYKKMFEVAKGRKILVRFNSNDFSVKNNKQIIQDNDAFYFNISQLEFDFIIELDFSQIHYLSGKQFLEKLTQNKKVNIIVGEDFKFGNKAMNSATDINKLYSNINVYISDILEINNVKISTSLIREQIEFGDINLINSLLVHNFVLSLNYTNSIFCFNKKQISLHPGIYICNIYVGNLIYKSFVHINQHLEIKIQIIDLEDIFLNIDWSKKIFIEFIKQLRIIFQSDKDLITEEDVYQTKKYFININKSV
ncbi:FAD synthase [Mycoplasma leonicaptivi]|uniref:FAD synthase n=1 Tax=Mycoplasma leonicaptivi TaxID=36742 RepID=UPI000486A9D4|nr:hypothetical protein [Mycoplasma leonicaptivi]